MPKNKTVKNSKLIVNIRIIILKILCKKNHVVLKMFNAKSFYRF